ncbi:SymE family type I addiction module toxin [Chitinophaga vietnamensis]|uniref:SymE family type I addiction module toxin n=1 Tax=Chitinophaga vietnamensis TaxID=2593957 RepID=UPI0011782044|nr:SymE family type I addiction module toxin [Chitinophaga vietnamensis]
MKNQHPTRQLKVKYLHQERRFEHKIVSCISLAGVWLEQAGFQIGDYVEVQVKNNRLVISKTNATRT